MLLKSLKFFSVLGLLFLPIIFQSCTAVPEATADYDIVFGDDYAPPIKKLTDTKVPEAVLLIPIPQKISSDYYKEFVSKFVTYYKERSLILPPGWKKWTQCPTPAEVQSLVQDTMSDAILFLKIEQPSAYPPMRIKVDVTLQLVKNDYILWEGAADYDAAQETVANSARRFLQKKLRRPNDPDKSLTILKNNYLFIHFAAWNLAKKLNELTNPPPDPNAPKEPIKEEKPKK